MTDLPLLEYAERQAVATERNWKKDGTSADAAAHAARKAPYWRGKVLEVLARSELTGDEIASRLDADVLTIRPRLTELLHLGHIETTGERRPTPRGRMADVWRARPAARGEAA